MGKRLLLIVMMLLPILAGCGGGNGNGNVSGGIQLSRIVGPRYTLTPIPPLSGDNALSVSGSNSSGQIVGYSWTQGITNAVTGSTAADAPHAFVVSNGVQRPLPALPGAKAGTSANGINDAGTIIGVSGATPVTWNGSSVSSLSGVAVSDLGSDLLFNNNGTIVPLDSTFVVARGAKQTLPALSSGDMVTATGLNASGVVVGFDTGGPLHPATATPVVWQNGAIKALSGLPGLSSSAGVTAATAINNQGEIVGAYGGHAVLWQNGQPVDLHKLLSGVQFSEAMSINNSGAIVGYAIESDGHTIQEFLYQNGVMTDIATLLPPGSGYTIGHSQESVKINDQGGILLGVLSSNGTPGWVLLSPNQ